MGQVFVSFVALDMLYDSVFMAKAWVKGKFKAMWRHLKSGLGNIYQAKHWNVLGKYIFLVLLFKVPYKRKALSLLKNSIKSIFYWIINSRFQTVLHLQVRTCKICAKDVSRLLSLCKYSLTPVQKTCLISQTSHDSNAHKIDTTCEGNFTHCCHSSKSR